MARRRSKHAEPAMQLDLGATCPPPGGSLEDAPLLTLDAIPKCAGHPVVVDTETTGLFWYKDHVIGIALYCPSAGIAGYIPVLDNHTTRAAAEMMRAWPAETAVIGHNFKFDAHFLGLDLRAMPWRAYDTIIMTHLLDSRGVPDRLGQWRIVGGRETREEKGSLALGEVARHYLADESKIELLREMQGVPHHNWPLRILSRYATEDARLTYELAQELMPRLRKRGQARLFNRIMEYMGIVWRTERHGLKLDLDYLGRAEAEILLPQLAELERSLFEHPRINQRFDWRSHSQLSKMLYDVYGHPRPVNPFSEETRFKTQYTRTGTSSFLLLEKANHPLGTTIIQMRGLDRLVGFVRQWVELMDSNGYVHSNFNMTGARTGRFSSDKPNLQQLPSDARSNLLTQVYEDIESLEAFFAQTNMRKAFVANPGHTIVAIDYKQQEIRLFAALARDPNLLNAILSGQDIHSSIAEQIWGQTVNPWRDWAKVVSFGMLYGMTAGSLEFRLNKTRAEAFEIMRQYHRAFPRVKPWMADVVEQMRRQGYVSYWSGRRYYRDDPEYHYKAVNALVQGGAADMLMEGCLELVEWFEEEGIPGTIVNYVHDEVDIELPTELVPEFAKQIARKMEVPHLLDLPFATDLKVGPNLGDLTKLAL